MASKQALLLSGYNALSQQHWANFVTSELDNFQWQQIALPGRYFSWRMRGAPLSLAAQDAQSLDQDYDLILATSSVDLAVTQSLYPALRHCRSILYFHENQFAYPQDNQPQGVVDWQMVNLYSALRADALLFNSTYNRNSFLEGLGALLKKLPDLVPAGIVESLSSKSDILPVPIQPPLSASNNHCINQKPIRILWNHRWEWDKNPELLLAIAQKISQYDLPVKLILTGQQFRSTPPALQRLLVEHAPIIEQAGFIDNHQQYLETLRHCDIVLSTAVHEFQGIAVLEAVSHGCTPLLPNRLSYPEIFPQEYLFSATGSIEKQAQSAVKKLRHWLAHGCPASPNVSHFYAPALIERYQQLIR